MGVDDEGKPPEEYLGYCKNWKSQSPWQCTYRRVTIFTRTLMDQDLFHDLWPLEDLREYLKRKIILTKSSKF